MNNVGLFFLAGEGTDQDLAAGIAWMKQAGQCGYAQAYCNLARFYDSGEFLEQDVNLALEYHRLAADGVTCNRSMTWV